MHILICCTTVLIASWSSGSLEPLSPRISSLHFGLQETANNIGLLFAVVPFCWTITKLIWCNRNEPILYSVLHIHRTYAAYTCHTLTAFLLLLLSQFLNWLALLLVMTGLRTASLHFFTQYATWLVLCGAALQPQIYLESFSSYCIIVINKMVSENDFKYLLITCIGKFNC